MGVMKSSVPKVEEATPAGVSVSSPPPRSGRSVWIGPGLTVFLHQGVELRGLQSARTAAARVRRESAIRHRGPHHRRIVASLRNTSAVSSAIAQRIAGAEERVLGQVGDAISTCPCAPPPAGPTGTSSWSPPPRRPVARRSSRRLRSGERNPRYFSPSTSPLHRLGLRRSRPAAKAILPSSRFSSTSGCGVSNSTATSVPGGKVRIGAGQGHALDQLRAKQPGQRAHRQAELPLVAFDDPRVFRPRLGQPQHGRVVPVRLVGHGRWPPGNWGRRPRADRPESCRPAGRASAWRP